MAKKATEEEELVSFIGETISSDSAILAAAINLMRAGNTAKILNDAELLLKVASGWFDLARYMSGDETSNSKPEHFGFAALETLDEPGNEPDEGEGGVEICKKPRKL